MSTAIFKVIVALNFMLSLPLTSASWSLQPVLGLMLLLLFFF